MRSMRPCTCSSTLPDVLLICPGWEAYLANGPARYFIRVLVASRHHRSNSTAIGLQLCVLRPISFKALVRKKLDTR